LLALCLVLLGALTASGAHAQGDSPQGQDRRFDFKPYVPPVFPLPPNATVTPGALSPTPPPNDPAAIPDPNAPPPPSGLRITIPTR
jgi:hypothetical protein